MQVTVETTQGLERKVKVEVPEDQVQGEVSKRLTNIAQSARLPGFRPGKAPMKVIAQRYGKQVREEVVGEIVQSSFQDAIAQESLRPAGTPTIDPLEWESGGGVAYTAVFDVYPEVSLPAIDSAENRRTRCRCQRRGSGRDARAPAQAAAQLGSRATGGDPRGSRESSIFEGVCDGKARDDLKSEGFAVELGAKQLFKEFEEGLVGDPGRSGAVTGPAFPLGFWCRRAGGQSRSASR